MKVIKYKKDFDYSYTLGAFPTLELLKNKSEFLINIYIHSSFNNEEYLKNVSEILKNSSNKIVYDDKVFTRLSDKENVFVIGVFDKYKMELNPSSHHVLLDNPSNMGNLGTNIRSALGFGFKNIAIVLPSADIFDPKTIRASMGSIFSVNIETFTSLEEYKAKYKGHTIYSFMLNAKNSLQNFEFKDTLSTLAFGNEARGLPASYLDENSIIITHSHDIDSLNVTNALTIGLYEFNKQIMLK